LSDINSDLFNVLKLYVEYNSEIWLWYTCVCVFILYNS